MYSYQERVRAVELHLECSGQLIPDTALRFTSVTAGASPSLNRHGRIQLYRCIRLWLMSGLHPARLSNGVELDPG